MHMHNRALSAYIAKHRMAPMTGHRSGVDRNAFHGVFWMSETAPASNMLVDNNRPNNTTVGQIIRFHGRNNGQNASPRQPHKTNKHQKVKVYPRIKRHPRWHIAASAHLRTERIMQFKIEVPRIFAPTFHAPDHDKKVKRRSLPYRIR